MNRRSSRGRVSAVAAGSWWARSVRIGLLAVAGALVLGDEARGQVGVESDREVLEAFYHATGGPDWLFNTNWLSASRSRSGTGYTRTTRVVWCELSC